MIRPFIVFDKNNFSIKIKNFLNKSLKNYSVTKSNLIIVVGGDGFMLAALKNITSLKSHSMELIQETTVFL